MKKKVMFISSTGGHFNELMRLRPLFSKYNTYIATEKQKTNNYLKEEFKHKVFFLIYGTKDHPFSYPFKLLINCFETIANINSKTITGRILYHIADLFFVQWESMLKLYPKAIYKGWIY